jgi:hypothetical protein
MVGGSGRGGPLVVLGGDWEASRRRYRERESEGKRKMGGWREKMDLGGFEGELECGCGLVCEEREDGSGKIVVCGCVCGGNVCARWRHVHITVAHRTECALFLFLE